MSSFDSYNAKTTSISYPWPAEVSGIERIALSAQGDLQRVLSAFFARPIVIALVYSQTMRKASLDATLEPTAQPTPSIIAAASPDSPIVQTRQVHLQCGGKIVCTAISTVRITSPEVAHLFLQEKYAIGQMFRRLEKVPAFELLSVGLGAVKDDKEKSVFASELPAANKGPNNQLWRRYTLGIPHFECEILEVFPDRRMFLAAEKWLAGDLIGVDNDPELLQVGTMRKNDPASVIFEGLKLVVGGGLLLILALEAVKLVSGQSSFC